MQESDFKQIQHTANFLDYLSILKRYHEEVLNFAYVFLRFFAFTGTNKP